MLISICAENTKTLTYFITKTKLVKQIMKEEYSENKFSKEQCWRTHTFRTEILAQKKDEIKTVWY